MGKKFVGNFSVFLANSKISQFQLKCFLTPLEVEIV